ncbi:MAG: hypothetical protein DWQ19_09120 [Crenarchaeota archaeon]|nr:MAG: hypothetical protein DWQ19_09120 [Thermoproteota archaeon]
MDIRFGSWLEEKEADSAMQEIRSLLNEILDQYGKPIPIKDNDPQSLLRQRFETEKEGQVCLTKYQGYQQHNPMIQAFAAQNPENFAQSLLFAPLTANTSFKRFNEWFPVLMQFLRTKETVTREEVANFISGMSGQRVGHPRGGQFSSVIDRGAGIKSKLISHVWNNRHDLFEECNKLAEEGKFKELLFKFAMLPGVQPVKAGFIVQLLYGQIGCLDTHNIKMYTALSDLMSKAPDLDKESREKWRDMGSRLKQSEKKWSRVEGKGTPKGEAKMEKAIFAYEELLNFMNKELGITPRVLWDVWVNYVAQRYEKDDENQYSRDQGISHAPDDSQLLKVFGGQDRTWKRMGRSANVINPHSSSGAVSRVHLMAAITPEELLQQIQQYGNDKYHVVNSAIRSDKDGRPALQTLSDRILDRQELQAILDAGGRVNAAIANAAAKNDKTLAHLEDNARKALYSVLVRKYAMHPKEANELLNIYTVTLNKLYKKHRDAIVSTLRAQATKDAKKAGTYIGSDEEMGYGVDTYDPNLPFKPKHPSNKTDRWAKSLEPHLPHLQAAVGTRKEYEKVEKRVSEQVAKKKEELKEIKKAITATKKIRTKAEDAHKKLDDLYNSLIINKANKEKRAQIRAKLSEANSKRREAAKEHEKAERAAERIENRIKELQEELETSRNNFKDALTKAQKKAQSEIDKSTSRHRRVLHGLEDEYEES